MIKATEFRIGNYVDVIVCTSHTQQIVDVMCDCINTIDAEGIPYDYVNPVELNEQWLLKFGFKKQNALNFIPCYVIKVKRSGIYFTIYEHEKGFFYPENNYYKIKLKYVHNLQNFFFVKTSEELTIKQ